jgi:hypothetical protein
MTPRSITVDLLEEVCNLALGPYWEGLSLRPETRAAIGRTPPSLSGIPFRSVVCTIDEARDLYDYLARGADAFITIGNPKGAVYFRGFDNTRRAFQLAGVSPRR